MFTSMTPEVTLTVPVALVVAAWLMTKLVPSVIEEMNVPTGMLDAAIIMPGARPVVLLPVIVVLEAVVTASEAATVVEVPSAEARPVFTTPPATMRRPLQEELAALRKSVPWSCLRREANWPAAAARSKALSNCSVLPPTTST